MKVESAQLPPFEDSDDKIFVTPNAVIMLDGASAFVPVPVPAATYAEHLGQHIAHTLTTAPEADLVEALADAIKATTDELDLTPGRSPSSTITIARERDEHLDLLVLGDNVVILPDRTITDDRIDRLDLEPARRYRERLAAGYGFDDEHRRLLRELQRQQVEHRNRPGGYWIAETEATAARHALTLTRPICKTPWAVLATDGAYNTLNHLRLAPRPTGARTISPPLDELLAQCQRWESEHDPDARKLPRAKRHDDKSLTHIQL
ncbi:hypothetical protein ORV05_34510 [Amycolatopsis cynarae]|uniref:Uncharacterized protein n=1 Tax=Amycolatopsis cynarae TaxID=2995223 RepID=A0ABY7B0U0_9PSEU|nr:hypothetical protein [Amycolatopsis sp. HUAS 11-8]WAL65912.1 hypothetical protein ORV05_34510 [Amycolatopsis sp. HUAS 11-8]